MTARHSIVQCESAMIWIFDLDNTLHDASYAIFPAITANMNRFIAAHLNKQSGNAVSLEDADQIRRLYWQRYGATISGMILHHDVKADDFLRAAHDLGDLALKIRSERGLIHLLKRLPGRKILLTNSSASYSQEVLKHLGIHKSFARQFSIELMRVNGRLNPKPSKKLFRKLIALEKIKPSHCVLIEDSESALKSARSVGMKTIWVTRYTNRDRFSGNASPKKSQRQRWNRPGFVDVKIRSVKELARRTFFHDKTA